MKLYLEKYTIHKKPGNPPSHKATFPKKSIKNEKAPAHTTLSSISNTHGVGQGAEGEAEQMTTGMVVKTVSGTAKGVKSDKLYPRNTKTRPGAKNSNYLLHYTGIT